MGNDGAVDLSLFKGMTDREQAIAVLYTLFMHALQTDANPDQLAQTFGLSLRALGVTGEELDRAQYAVVESIDVAKEKRGLAPTESLGTVSV